MQPSRFRCFHRYISESILVSLESKHGIHLTVIWIDWRTYERRVRQVVRALPLTRSYSQ